MKSVFMYNYNFKDPIITKAEKDYYIKEAGKTYIFKEIGFEKLEFVEYTNKDESFYKCIKNRLGEYIIVNKNRNYILLEINKKIEIEISEVIKNITIKSKVKEDWGILWKKKIDMLEKTIKNSNQESLIESNDYFIGLAENAICFLEYNKNKINKNDLSICRKRITKENFRLPNNTIIDFKERDLAEYIKYLFFEEKADNTKIMSFVRNIDLKNYNKYLIYARLLLPTNYFDIVEDAFITEKDEKKKIEVLINEAYKYEALLKRISELFFHNEVQLEWIKKTRK